MSQAPTQQNEAATDRYLKAWQDLAILLREGQSFSGYERNCCFLNTGGPRFADVSAATGLDLIDDARGLAAVDWDQDGDLDFWLSNRTAPQVRFMRNDHPREHDFLAVRLTGKSCNRDAVGARLELHFTDAAAKPLIRTLRAGEGFLSQSSKWVHFGLAKGRTIDRLVVRWPGGAAEEFRGLAANQRFHLVQGAGQGAPLSIQRNVALVAAEPKVPKPSEQARIVVQTQRPPLARLDYLGFDDRPQSVNVRDGRVKLVNLWATWCAPCLTELREFAAQQSEFRAAGIEVVALCVDGLGDKGQRDPAAARNVLKELGFAGPAGMASREFVAAVDQVQRGMMYRQTATPVPTSILLTGLGEIAVIYKGPAKPAQVLADAKAALTYPTRDMPGHFTGRRALDSFPAKMMDVVQSHMEGGYWNDARAELNEYLRLDPLPPSPANDPAGRERNGRVALVYRTLGDIARREKKPADALRHYQDSLRYLPGHPDSLNNQGVAHKDAGRPAEAVASYQAALASKADFWPAVNNLAWLYAAYSDEKVRQPEEAVRLAEKLCAGGNRSQPAYLDTLAAAYARAGRKDDAVKTAQEALKLARDQHDPDLAQEIAERLKVYEKGEAYTDGAPAAPPATPTP